MASLRAVLQSLLAVAGASGIGGGEVFGRSPLLPSGPIVLGYQDWGACDAADTLRAVEGGVNVVVWFAVDLAKNKSSSRPLVQSGPSYDCVAHVRAAIEAKNLTAAHLIAIGGWNAPHPDTSFTGEEWFAAWDSWNRALPRPFDGFDWDLEGHDNPAAATNEFAPEVLQLMVDMSVAAKRRGLVVTMVPAESYLDVTSSSFNRSLRFAYADWHPEFRYHGMNCYAYVLAAAPPGTFDLVIVQLYESYSRAGQALHQRGVPGADHLRSWIPTLLAGWNVSFGDPRLPLRGWREVRVRPDQLVVGLSFGSADGSGKSAFFSPRSCGQAYAALGLPQRPRGFGFWNIRMEGSAANGTSTRVTFATELNSFLRVRESLLV
mmetsp:Transcript_95756/g.298197  ORF Transcript_95756/g.298197 Transcript_95756/m.298197 type:complete len:376 (+) Transcript_95756:94-1221(+)